MEFLINSVSNNQESSNLCIAHRDSWRHLIFWLNNLFLQEKIIWEKTLIGNDTLLVYLFRWDTCITWNLLFPVFEWKNTLDTVNKMSIDIFWKPFYKVDGWLTDIIALHDAFLDFIDLHKENSLLQMPEFYKKLCGNPLTQHFTDVIDPPIDIGKNSN